MIAIALACGPDLLIADEPTTALDATTQAQILALIGDLVQQQGMALLLVSHNLGVIAQHAQHTLVMYGGTLVEAGPTAQLFDRPAHPYTRGLLAARPRLDTAPGTRLATIAGTVPALADLPAGCPFAGRCERREPACDRPPPLLALTEQHTVRCVRPYRGEHRHSGP
jgi:peptide/nickel transport system ATP-binding protein